MTHTITVNLDVQSSIRAVLSKEWINELIEQAKIQPEDGGDVFLHRVYTACHTNAKPEGPWPKPEQFDSELFARTVFSNGIRKVLGNVLGQFLGTAGGIAGTVSPAKLRYTEVPAAERARLLRLESEKPKLALVPAPPKEFVAREVVYDASEVPDEQD